MDNDRKSAVSSFYGGRRASSDALQQDFPSPTHYADYPSHARQDSRSSFFNPNAPHRGSVELLNQQSAGYNPTTFFDGGRQEPVKGGHDEEAAFRDEPFDIYADFNNAGPRYSRATFGTDNGYLHSGSMLKVEALTALSSQIPPCELPEFVQGRNAERGDDRPRRDGNSPGAGTRMAEVGDGDRGQEG